MNKIFYWPFQGGTSFVDLLFFCSVLCLLCLCARLFICALWSPAGKGLTSWLSFVVSAVSLSLSHWYPGSGVVLGCIDSWSLQPYLLCEREASASSASALYSVGLVTALYTGKRERCCLVTPCESVSKALGCLSTNNFCIQLVPFNYSPHKKWLFQLLSFTVFYDKAPIVIYTMSIHYVFWDMIWLFPGSYMSFWFLWF